MPMYHCKTVEYTKELGTKKVLSIFDVNRANSEIVTHVQPPYRSILKHMGEVLAMRTHENIKDALRFHYDVADDLHSIDPPLQS